MHIRSMQRINTVAKQRKKGTLHVFSHLCIFDSFTAQSSSSNLFLCVKNARWMGLSIKMWKFFFAIVRVEKNGKTAYTLFLLHFTVDYVRLYFGARAHIHKIFDVWQKLRLFLCTKVLFSFCFQFFFWFG